MNSDKLKNYKALLVIRRAAKRRNTVILGWTFLISFIALFAFVMLEELSGRSLYFVTALVLCFGAGYFSEWVKLENLKGSIDLIDNLFQIME